MKIFSIHMGDASQPQLLLSWVLRQLLATATIIIRVRLSESQNISKFIQHKEAMLKKQAHYDTHKYAHQSHATNSHLLKKLVPVFKEVALTLVQRE